MVGLMKPAFTLVNFHPEMNSCRYIDTLRSLHLTYRGQIRYLDFTLCQMRHRRESHIAHWASPLTVAWTEPFVQIYTKFAKIFNHILKIYALN